MQRAAGSDSRETQGFNPPVDEKQEEARRRVCGDRDRRRFISDDKEEQRSFCWEVYVWLHLHEYILTLKHHIKMDEMSALQK